MQNHTWRVKSLWSSMVVFYFHSMTSRCKIPRCTMRHKNNGSLTDHFCLRWKTSDSKSFIYLEKHLWYTSALTSLYAVLHVKKEIIISERNFEHQIPRPGSWQPEFPRWKTSSATPSFFHQFLHIRPLLVTLQRDVTGYKLHGCWETEKYFQIPMDLNCNM